MSQFYRVFGAIQRNLSGAVMIDLKLVQKQPEVLAKALADRHSDLSVDAFLELDGKRRTLLTEIEGLKSKRNEASGQVAALKRSGQDATELLAELSTLSDRIKNLEGETVQAKAHVESWLMRVPNIPDCSVPWAPTRTKMSRSAVGAARASSTSRCANTATSALRWVVWILSVPRV